jgi:Putative polyhydroxyalkanoic acid system protein (PHA_gran_rgn)
MRIERSIQVGRAAAIQKVDAFIDDLSRMPMADGISIKEVTKSWADNVMTFSFKAKKGFFGATISGTARVNDDSAILDLELPAILKAFVSEDQIRAAINKEFDKFFAT